MVRQFFLQGIYLLHVKAPSIIFYKLCPRLKILSTDNEKTTMTTTNGPAPACHAVLCGCDSVSTYSVLCLAILFMYFSYVAGIHG